MKGRRLSADWKRLFEARVRDVARELSVDDPGFQIVELDFDNPGREATGVDPRAMAKARLAVARLNAGRSRVLTESERRAHLRARVASARRTAALLQKTRSR